MATEKSGFKLFTYGSLIVLLLFGLIRILISLGGNFLKGELVVFIGLLFLSFIGFVGYVRAWGERVLFFTFLIYLANLILVWYLTGAIYMVLLFLALVGFLMSISKKVEKDDFSYVPETKQDGFDNEPHSQVFDVDINDDDTDDLVDSKDVKYEDVVEKNGPIEKVDKPKAIKPVTTVTKKVAKKPVKKAVKTKHSPGKYLASKNSNLYHEPKCEWAKKIKPARRNWFKSKEDAWEQGYKAHACVK